MNNLPFFDNLIANKSNPPGSGKSRNYSPGGLLNLMSDANGGVVTVSSISSATNYQPTYMINGDRAGQAAHYWQDSTSNTYPDWVEVTFASEVEINEVDLFSVQDSYTAPQEPTEAMTFNNYGVSAYDVQYWDAATSSWTTVAGVSGNNKVWSKLTFSAVKTTKLRINITNAKGGYSRIAELEVYTPAGGATQRFDAWGNVLTSTGTIPQYGYTGREPDETGLVYYRARYYDPTIGRFTQRDPIGLMGGVNQYAYVDGNPVNFSDPMGLELKAVSLPGTGGKIQTFYFDSVIADSVVRFVTEARAKGINVTVNNGLRTLEEQQSLRQSNPSGNPVAKGLSKHNAGFAVDLNGASLNSLTPEQRVDLEYIGMMNGLTPLKGGLYPGKVDPPHFEANPKNYGYKNLKEAVQENQADYKRLTGASVTSSPVDRPLSTSGMQTMGVMVEPPSTRISYDTSFLNTSVSYGSGGRNNVARSK